MKRRRLVFLLIGIGSLSSLISSLCALFIPARPALAHAELRHSDPAPGATLDRPPTEVFVWFSMPLSTGSKLSVYDGQFQVADKGETFIDASDARLMRIRLGSIGPGRYTVVWKAAAVDGHVTTGSYDFYVRSGPELPVLAIAAGVGGAFLLLIVGLWLRSRIIRNRRAQDSY
jgi:methionine-rich copper-binding protein CopC